jgi:hypothetical protein
MSGRAANAPGDWANYGAVSPVRWPAFFLPTLFGHPGFATCWLSEREPSFEMGLYHGALIPPLACVGLLGMRRSAPGGFCLTVLVLVGLTLGGGDLHIISAITRRLPILGSIRVPARFLAFTGLGLCGLAAIGWDELRRGTAGARRVMLSSTLVLCITVVVDAVYLYLGVVLGPENNAEAERLARIAAAGFLIRFDQMLTAEVPWTAACLAVGLIAACFARQRPFGALIVAAAALSIDVGRHARGWYPTAAPAFHAEPGSARAIRKRFDPPRVFVHWRANLARKVDLGQQGYRLMNPWRAIGECLYYERGPLFDVGLITDVGLLPLQTQRMAEFRARMAGASHFLQVQGVQAEMSPLPIPNSVYQGEGCSVAPVKDAAPFAYFCPRTEWVESGKALDRLLPPEEINTRPQDRVILEGEAPQRPVSAGEFTPARAVWHGPNRFTISVDAPADGALVVNELWYPGWTAVLDGKASPILRANHLFMGVPVSRGRATIEFVFASSAVRIGALISLFAVLGLAAALVLWRSPPQPHESFTVYIALVPAVFLVFAASFVASAVLRQERWLEAAPTLLSAW